MNDEKMNGNVAFSDDDFKKWMKERDKAVKSLDINVLKAFYNKWKRKGFYFEELPEDEVLKIAIHKMALEITTIPPSTKTRAANWLKKRGYYAGVR